MNEHTFDNRNRIKIGKYILEQNADFNEKIVGLKINNGPGIARI